MPSWRASVIAVAVTLTAAFEETRQFHHIKLMPVASPHRPEVPALRWHRGSVKIIGGKRHVQWHRNKGSRTSGTPECLPSGVRMSPRALALARTRTCTSSRCRTSKCDNPQRSLGDTQWAMTQLLGTGAEWRRTGVRHSSRYPSCEKGVAEEVIFRRTCSHLILKMDKHLERTRGRRGLVFVFTG